MDLVVELNNEDTKKKFQVFKNVFFDSKAIAALLILLHETQGSLYRSEILSFGHIDLQRKPLFGNRKYF